MNKVLSLCCGVSLSFSLAVLPGCGGGGGKPTAPVSGKVMHMGQPVSGGQVTFVPLAQGAETGKPGAGEVQSDGSFKISTYGTADGAVLGKHKVMYTPPPPMVPVINPGDPPPTTQPMSQYAGLEPQQEEVEVKSGKNEFNIELVPGKPTP